MRILVTGGTGFIGQFLQPRLIAAGHEVHNLEQYFFQSIGKMQFYPNIHIADISDAIAVKEIYEKVKPQIIIHLAAITAVAYSYNHFREVLNTNFIGTVNLAEMALRVCSNFLQFIYPSSAEVYGVSPKLLKKENQKLIPNSPYAVSKEACERYLQYMYEAYQFPVTIFRPFNSYGRKKSRWFVIEKIIWQMVRKQPVCYLGDPKPVRDFLYVDDHVEAYIQALNNSRAIGRTMNLSTGVGITIKDLAEKIKKLTGFEGKIEWQTMPKRPLDIMHLVGSNEKLKRLLKIPKPLSLDEGLKRTIKYWEWKVEKENDYYKKDS